MRTFAKLFGKSPFVPLQAHMDKVARCVDKVAELVGAFLRGDYARIEALAAEVSALEHEADQIKHDIQDHVPRGLFMAVEPGIILEALGVQDSIADKAENLGVLLTLKRMTLPPALHAPFNRFVEKNLECFRGVRTIIDEVDELLEAGFGGDEAERVMRMVADVCRIEHEADVIQRDLARQVFAREDELTKGEFHLLNQVVQTTSELSNLSERLANRIRRMLNL